MAKCRCASGNDENESNAAANRSGRSENASATKGKFPISSAHARVRSTGRTSARGAWIKRNPAASDQKKRLYGILEWAENEFHRFLLEAREAERARDYLEQRGLTAKQTVQL